MHGEPSILERDDSVLLAEWVEGREEAFAQLVAQYQRLVVGAALRWTGNAELARDVAQQVFATLAAKARLLIGRRNIGGWLYQAASHFGARAALSERRRAAMLGRAVEEHGTARGAAQGGEEEMWPAVEEAIASLGAPERESIVLHYLQDLSYTEMAGVLGMTEPAVRKRVSRALRTLESRLRGRGVKRSAAAVLTGVLAQQSGVTASAGLASGAVASAAGASLPVSLFLQTIMSHTTAKAAACVTAAILVPLALQWNANASLREQIASARANPPPAIGDASETTARQLAALRAELAAKREAVMAAENEAVRLGELKRKVESEVVYSMGTVETMAKKLAKMARMDKQMSERQAALQEALKKGKDSEEAKQASAAMKKTAEEAAEMMPNAMGLLREMVQFERSSEKAARFYATFLGELMELDEPERTRMEARIRPWVEQLQQEGLAFPQRPNGPSRAEWNQRRLAATTGFLDNVSQEFPGSPATKDSVRSVFNSVLEFIDMIPTEGGPR